MWCAIILRNAYVTTNGNITSAYFNILPPEFEDSVNMNSI